MKRLISAMLVLVMSISIFSSLSVTASAGVLDRVVTGEMQDTSAEDNGTIYWELSYSLTSSTASLKISGDGYMPNGTDQCWKTALGSRYINELIIEEGVKSIMEGAFAGESRLQSVTLPDSLEFIGDSAFADTSISHVTLPENLQDFNGTVFNSESIEHYNVSPENPYFTAVDGVVYSKDLTKLVAYPVGRYANGGANDFVIPESVTEIGKYAFLNCKHTSFKIPGTVKDIQYQAFAGNTQLKSIAIENGVENIYDNAFLACNKLTSVHLPTSVKYIGYCTFGFIYALDYDGLAFMLDQQGIEHEEITDDNVAYYISLSGCDAECFIYCTVNDSFKIYAPTNSAGHNYCKMFDVAYRSSQAITPKPTSAKQTEKGVEIKWTYSSDADGYYIYRKNKSGEYEKIKTVTGKENLSYTDTKAYSSYNNTYTVKAYNENGVSRYFTDGVSAYYIAAPKLSLASNHNSGIKVYWEKVSTATDYNIYRKAESDTNWEYIGTVDKSRLYYIDKDVENLDAFSYTVRACDDNSISDYDKVGVSKRYIEAPEVSTFKNTTKGVQIGWERVSVASSYRVYRKTGDGDWVLLKKLNNSTFTYTDETAKSGVKYSYAVRAIGSGVSSGYYTQTTVYLDKPLITSATSTKTGVTVKYSQSSGATKYRIYRKVSGASEWTYLGTVKGDSTLSYKDETAQKGVTYYYTVRAFSGSYKSAYDYKTGYKIKDNY